jgi:hypothetical protein
MLVVDFRKVHFEGKDDDHNCGSKDHCSRCPAMSLPRGMESTSIVASAVQALHLNKRGGGGGGDNLCKVTCGSNGFKF